MEPRRLALDPFGDFTGGYETYRENWREGIQRFVEEKRAVSVRLALPLYTADREWGEEIFEELMRVDPEKDDPWDLLLILDEVHRYTRDRNETFPLQQLVLQARRIGIRMAVGSQRMVYVPQVMLNETTDLVAFKMNGPLDRKRLEDWTEEGAADEVWRLERGECLLWSPL